MSFDQLGLSAELLGAIADEGYTQPTPVQAQAIPLVLEGRDVLAGAQTGTGKTAGFTLPMLQLLAKTGQKGRHPRALVLTPTRELAAQIGESVKTYGKSLPLRSTVIFGGVGINPQIDKLRRGVDILVATPGRLLDHAGQRTVDLSHIEILVLDEADRMLDMGFIHDIRRVLKLLPKERQNLLFSATYSDEIKRLASGVLSDPAEVAVARRNTAAETVDQLIVPVAKESKRELLSRLVRENEWNQVLVFTRTKHGANRLSKQLEQDGVTSAAIHGNKSQNARTSALAGFKSGDVRVLVATDIAARGLDIDGLPHVVNFELPNVPEDYVHRIGRTGRAGSEGAALSLVSYEESKLLADIQKLLGREIACEPAPGFEGEELNLLRPPPPPARGGGGGGGRGRGGQGRGGQGRSQGRAQGQSSGEAHSNRHRDGQRDLHSHGNSSGGGRGQGGQGGQSAAGEGQGRRRRRRRSGAPKAA